MATLYKKDILFLFLHFSFAE